VRAVGLSNETAWGAMSFLAAASAAGGALPRVASLQNAYSLTCRTFEARCRLSTRRSECKHSRGD